MVIMKFQVSHESLPKRKSAEAKKKRRVMGGVWSCLDEEIVYIAAKFPERQLELVLLWLHCMSYNVKCSL